MGYFCPKNTFLQLKHYLPKIYLTLLSTTCVKFIKLLMPFLKPYISHFSRHSSSVFFLAQTLHTFYKSSPSKCKFSDFPLLGLKFTNFLMSFFKQKVSFSSKFGSFFSVMRGNSSIHFLVETLYDIEKSSTSKCKLSDLPLLVLKFTKFLMSLLEPSVSFSSTFGHASMS